MCLGQIVALMMVNKCMKFQEICFSTFKVIAKVKVCHDDNNNNENNDYPAADNTRVITKPRLFFVEKHPS